MNREERKKLQAEQFENMKKFRNIPFAEVGMTVIVNGNMGKIVGSNSSQNLDVFFPELQGKRNCHPHWKISYFKEDGTLIKEYKTDERRD